MIQVLLRIGHIDVALKKCEEWREVVSEGARKMITLLEAEARFRRAQTLRGYERIGRFIKFAMILVENC